MMKVSKIGRFPTYKRAVNVDGTYKNLGIFKPACYHCGAVHLPAERVWNQINCDSLASAICRDGPKSSRAWTAPISYGIGASVFMTLSVCQRISSKDPIVECTLVFFQRGRANRHLIIGGQVYLDGKCACPIKFNQYIQGEVRLLEYGEIIL